MGIQRSIAVGTRMDISKPVLTERTQGELVLEKIVGFGPWRHGSKTGLIYES
jgi:hypothetical protein